MILKGTIQQDKMVLEPTSDAPTGKTSEWKGQASGSEMNGAYAGGETGRFSLNKVPFQPSPTLGEKAPAEAIVFFEGINLDAWESRRAPAEPIQWLVTDSGALEVVSARAGKKNKQDLKTKDTFGDYRLHLEFKLAHKPEATGQGRSNSGVIHLGLYETQILDSFGLYGRDNECGGIYKTRDPTVMPAIPLASGRRMISSSRHPDLMWQERRRRTPE